MFRFIPLLVPCSSSLSREKLVETEADGLEIGTGTWKKKVTLARNIGDEGFKRKKGERRDDRCCVRLIYRQAVRKRAKDRRRGRDSLPFRKLGKGPERGNRCKREIVFKVVKELWRVYSGSHISRPDTVRKLSERSQGRRFRTRNLARQTFPAIPAEFIGSRLQINYR